MEASFAGHAIVGRSAFLETRINIQTRIHIRFLHLLPWDILSHLLEYHAATGNVKF